MPRPKPGDPAPDFSGLTTDGARVSLEDFRGKKLVLYFYPKDDTPGCTAQACSLRDHNAEIKAKGAAILGVSAQDVASHERFTKKHRLNFPLLADTDRSVARAYGTIGGGVGGALRGMLGLAERVTFIIDEKGRVVHVIDSPDTANHAEQVLKLL
ncbi:MAG TPA: peroxiredoxin [Burkholderiales bacterium]|nr:peroxiredoxin [Burkholderiales bacterium]